jgi:hypothetical protein
VDSKESNGEGGSLRQEAWVSKEKPREGSEQGWSQLLLWEGRAHRESSCVTAATCV